jgi:hypothetical protein
MLGLVGLNRAFPAAGIYSMLNASGRTAFAQLSTECIQQAIPQYALARVDQYTTDPGLLASPTMRQLLSADGLGHHPPRFPILNYHSLTDEVVPYAQDAALVAYYCSQRTPVDHVTFVGDHISGAEVRTTLVTPWLQQLFNGAPIINTCP